jgi:hypothetical protein
MMASAEASLCRASGTGLEAWMDSSDSEVREDNPVDGVFSTGASEESFRVSALDPVLTRPKNNPITIPAVSQISRTRFGLGTLDINPLGSF